MHRTAALFTGQGIPSGQLAELRRLAKIPSVLSFIAELSSFLADEVRGISAAISSKHLAHGLDIHAWALDRACAPDITYLNSPPVALVLTHTIQLGAFRYMWRRFALHDAAASAAGLRCFPQVIAPSGHSQGMAAADPGTAEQRA